MRGLSIEFVTIFLFVCRVQIILERQRGRDVPHGRNRHHDVHVGKSGAKFAVHRLRGGRVEERPKFAVGNVNRVDRSGVSGLRRGTKIATRCE